MGPKTLPTIWHTYMKLVTKYQIPIINSCLEKCGIILLISEKRNQTPLRGQDGKISDTRGKDIYWSPTRRNLVNPKVFIAVVVAFIICLLNTLYLFYEIHLKYCQDTDAYIDKSTRTPAGKISIGLQLGGTSLETTNLSLGCLRFFRLALLLVLDPLYFAQVQDKIITHILPENACGTVYDKCSPLLVTNVKT
jgi:hypothetical protein